MLTTLMAQMPAAITIEPPNATAYDLLTLIFDPAEACFTDGTLEGLDSIAIHSGVGYQNGQTWQSVIDWDGVGYDGQSTILYPTGDGKFSKTYVPFEYYGFPEGVIVTQICAVFNNGTDWNQDGRDFLDDSDCMDFFIPIAHPCLSEGLTIYTQEQIDNFQTNYPGCIEIEGSVQISGDDITNLNGLNVITCFGNDFVIENNPNLMELTGLENVLSIEGFLAIEFNNSITSLAGLESLSHIDGPFFIGGNNLLTSFTGLDNLQSIEGVLEIGIYESGGYYGNPSLINLSGLENLDYIGGNLSIKFNESLSSITALENIDPESISDLFIYDNISLSTCDIQSICDYLANPNGTIEIHDNAIGCNSQEEVEEACTASILEVSTFYGINTQPNPFSSSITIEYKLKQTQTVQISIFNQFGQLVYQQTEDQVQGLQQLHWKAQDQAEGLYYYRLQAAKHIINGKMMKIQ